jgi:predicted MPP superfamily phosphohydrolase
MAEPDIADQPQEGQPGPSGGPSGIPGQQAPPQQAPAPLEPEQPPGDSGRRERWAARAPGAARVASHVGRRAAPHVRRAAPHVRRAAPLGRFLARRGPRALAVVLVAFVGGALGSALTPSTTAEVGPLQAEVRVVPSLNSGVQLLLPPAGEVEFDAYSAPVAVQARISRVDLDGARALLESPAQVRALGDTAADSLRSAAIRATLLSVGCTLLGAVGLSLLVWRRSWRRTAEVAGTAVAVLLATGGLAWATAEPDRLAQPKFTGLLSQAPYIAGEVPSVLQRLETYRSGLADIVRSVTTLYATAGSLPQFGAGADPDGTVTVLHVSDIHLNPLAFDLIDKIVQQFGVDVVVDTGDITTWGTAVESRTLARIGQVGVPYVFVRGNHDSAGTEAAVASNRNAIVLDDEVAEVAGVVIAGIGDPVFTPSGAGPQAALAPGLGQGSPNVAHAASVSRLASTVEAWDAQHGDRPVQIAAIHEPVELGPLMGRVPMIFAGHTHSRATTLDKATGTAVLVEGSTGGAGITARGLERLSDGKPLPLAASLVHIATTGERAGRPVAIDAITVGGFGLTSVNLERTVLRPEDTPELTPEPTPTPTVSGSPGATPTAPVTPATPVTPVTSIARATPSVTLRPGATQPS